MFKTATQFYQPQRRHSVELRQAHPRILFVSKNIIFGIDVRIGNIPVRFLPQRGKGAEVWVYHYLTRGTVAGEYTAVSALMIRRETGIDLREFDLIVVYLSAEGVLRVGAKPATFPIREEDLRKVQTDKLVFVTVDEPRDYLPLLERVGHAEARVIRSDAGGGETMQALFDEAYATGEID